MLATEPRDGTFTRYDLGKPYPDGRRAVWAKLRVRGPRDYPAEWVIVHVADSRADAIDWIKAQRQEG